MLADCRVPGARHSCGGQCQAKGPSHTGADLYASAQIPETLHSGCVESGTTRDMTAPAPS